MASIASTTHLPPLGAHQRDEIGRELEGTPSERLDLSLVGKQLHWSLVGPLFRALHEQLDELVDSSRELADTVPSGPSRSGFGVNNAQSCRTWSKD